MLYQRVLSAAVGIPVLLAAVWRGGWLLFAATVLLMLLSLYEFNRLFIVMGTKTSFFIMAAGMLVLSAGALWGGAGAYGLAVVPVVMLMLISGVLSYPGVTPAAVAVRLTGTLYVSLLIYFYLIRTLDGGQLWILTLLAAIWAGDTVAYFTGKKLGKRKLAPDLSPGKTVEGAVCGLAGCILGAFAVYFLFPALPSGQVLAVGAVAGVFGIIGDLFESSLKRQGGIKDSGTVIPGHGGVLDRFDSLIFAAPAVYYLLSFWSIG
ncbi:MAG: phosphatidate cytidylyltransferase [Actinobacteria bacterium]|nr:phosphatidate cytidylyltransferase [Actinomycetota bacterium]